MKTQTVQAQARTVLTKQFNKSLRTDRLVPGVIYGGQQDLLFVVSEKELKPIVYTPEFMKVAVNLEGKVYNCILKDLQFDKVSEQLIHIDFLELIENKKVIATLPLKFVGVPAGVKAGGKLVTKIKSLNVKALPKDLKEFIEIDISKLELNANLRVQDIKVDNIEILNTPRIPIATVVLTRQLKQEEAAAAPAAASQPAKAAAATATTAAAKPAEKKPAAKK